MEALMILGSIVMSAAFTWVIASVHKEEAMEQAAVKAGVAEFYLDENNERQFRYKKSPQN